MVRYSVTVINNGNRKWKFAAYQKPPKSTTKSLAWFITDDYISPGERDGFQWSVNYQFVFCRKGSLSPGVIFTDTGNTDCDPYRKNKANFTYKNNTPLFSAATAGGPDGKLEIIDGPNVPYGRFSVGIAMSGNGVFAEIAGPNVTHTFTPHPNYWIRAMDVVKLGEVMDLTTTTQDVRLDFPDLKSNATATLQQDNTWRVSYS